MVEHVEHARIGLCREAFDADAGHELVAQPGRVSAPQVETAHDGIEIHAGGWDVQLYVDIAGQTELQIVHQLIAKMLFPGPVFVRVAPHAAHPHDIAYAVLNGAERFLEAGHGPIRNGLTDQAIIIVDQIDNPALLPKRRNILDHEGIDAFVVRAFLQELRPAFRVDHRGDLIGEVRCGRGRIA